ncbi:hypothetical protein Baya_10750 [Bagarius yarrelli]|uniref:Uncharacterized protein n=1 Tax=Bagarius yarrelli TaxID=175774 RepID=A0A556UGE0_BAGYA|nr:hypothetical protein Baya_10750 [Bagarius yarrelli]
MQQVDLVVMDPTLSGEGMTNQGHIEHTLLDNQFVSTSSRTTAQIEGQQIHTSGEEESLKPMPSPSSAEKRNDRLSQQAKLSVQISRPASQSFRPIDSTERRGVIDNDIEIDCLNPLLVEFLSPQTDSTSVHIHALQHRRGESMAFVKEEQEREEE